MSDALKAEAANALAQLLKDIQSAKDFAIEQAPEVIQQMVGFMAFKYGVISMLGFTIVAICGTACFLSWRHAKKEADASDAGMIRVIGTMVPGVISILGIMLFIDFGIQFVQAAFYPKWFIVEHLAKLLS